MTQARLPLWFLVFSWALVFVAFTLGVALGRRSPLPDPQATALQLVYQEIERSYVDRVDGKELLDRAIASMARLDDYSRYVPTNEVAQFVEETTGSYEGIGVVLHFADDGLYVRTPIEGGPGDRAGLVPGDRIVAIDGDRLDSMTKAQLAQLPDSRLRGPSPSTVQLTVARANGEERTVAVQRGAVQKRSVKWTQWLDREQGLAYAHIADFHVGATKALQDDLRALAQASGREVAGLVIDLRFDLGGNLDEAVAMARMFVREGNLVSMRRRDTEVLERFDADAKLCTHATLPLVLLVNESSASASEVVAGALQDHGRAAIVGEASYGKGVVNTIYEWQDLPFRLKLTTARYFTPKGRNLDRGRHRNGASGAGDSDGNGNGDTKQEGGIQPDQHVAFAGDAEDAVRAALADFPVAERHLEAMRAFAEPRGLRMPGIVPPADDPQLAAAIATLRERIAK